MVATSDPAELSELTTWYLVIKLPTPGSLRGTESELIPAEVAEVVRLYALRNLIE